MKFRLLSFLLILPGFIFAQTDTLFTGLGNLVIHPVYQASMVWEWNGEVIYVDPSGDPALYKGLPDPTMVLITENKEEHLDTRILNRLKLGHARLVAPKAVLKELGALRMRFDEVTELNNGQIMDWKDASTIEAVPVYESRWVDGKLKYVRTEGNGYLLNLGIKRLYVSGDTEYTPEMSAVRDIDIAFVPVEVPSRVDREKAAEVVLTLRPKVVYPFQYGGSAPDNMTYFTSLIAQEAPEVEVRVRAR